MGSLTMTLDHQTVKAVVLAWSTFRSLAARVLFMCYMRVLSMSYFVGATHYNHVWPVMVIMSLGIMTSRDLHLWPLDLEIVPKIILGTGNLCIELCIWTFVSFLKAHRHAEISCPWPWHLTSGFIMFIVHGIWCVTRSQQAGSSLSVLSLICHSRFAVPALWSFVLDVLTSNLALNILTKYKQHSD